MSKIKIVSDFDGIWTNQAIEAKYVWEFINSSLSDLTNIAPEEIERLLQGCKDEMNKEAYKYGWINGGAIAAFYREDPYGDNNAIFDFIDKQADIDPERKKIKEDILKKYSSLAEFSQDCFVQSTTKFKDEGKLVPVETTRNLVNDLKSNNVEIVVASNSKTEKIKYLFSRAGIEVSDDSSPERNVVHARGDARKFVVDNNYNNIAEYLEISEQIKVPLRRSSYHKILSEEKPDFVIGDVFSLDIALPLYMRMNDKEFGKLKVIQRLQPYTPGWVKDYLKRDEFKNIAFMVDSLEEVSGVINKFLT